MINLVHERRKFGLYAALPVYGIIMSSMALVGSFPVKFIGIFLNPAANILVGIIAMSTHLIFGWSSLSSYTTMVLLFCISIAVNLLFWLLIAYKINKYLDSRKRLGLSTSKRVKISTITAIFAVIILVQIAFFSTESTPQHLKDAGYTLYCDEHLFQTPNNCRIEDESGVLISKEKLLELEGCWREFDGNFFSCRLKTPYYD